MEFGQLINITREIFGPELFSENLKLSISLTQQSEILHSLPLLYVKTED